MGEGVRLMGAQNVACEDGPATCTIGGKGVAGRDLGRIAHEQRV